MLEAIEFVNELQLAANFYANLRDQVLLLVRPFTVWWICVTLAISRLTLSCNWLSFRAIMISLATMILRSIAAMNILLLFVLVILAPTFVSALAPSTDNNYTLLPPPPRVIPPLTKPSAVTRVTIEGGAVVSVHFYFQPNETYYAIYFDPHHDPRKKGLQPQPICFALALGLPKLGDDSFSPGGCFFRGMPDSIQCLTQNMNESNPCSRKKQHTIESGKRDYFLKNPKACGVDYVDIGK